MTDIAKPVTTRFMVTEQLGQTMQWWYRNGRRLQEQHGFPAPLPGFGMRKWDPRLVEAWKLARTPLELRQPAPDPAGPAARGVGGAAARGGEEEARARKLAERIARVTGGSPA